MVSIVVPVFNEESNIKAMHAKLMEHLPGLGRPFEIIMVDDGSQDRTFEELKKLSPVRVIRFQKNSGQTSAMDAGFQAARGDVIVTLDGDLQNDPSDIDALIKKLEEGYDVVSGWRVDRHDSFGRRMLSRSANWLTHKVTGLYLHDYACAIKAYRSTLFKGVHLYGEMHVFLPAYLYGRGARVTEIPVKHHERQGGVSKHYFMKAVKDISDLLTIQFLSQHMDRPLLFFGTFCLIFWFLGFLSVATSIALKLLELRNFAQTPLPLLASFFIMMGFLLFMMGFLAELMVRIYCETQKITPYIVKETIENK